MSATLRPDDIAIARLRIRGPVDMRTRVQRELEQASWPQAPGESWVLLRQVQVCAPLSGVTRRLIEQTRQQVAHAGDDNVVHFANLGELLAHLLADLARGVAAQRWYWQNWSHLFALPRVQALTTLMREHLTQLPSLCVRLAQARELALVWQALDEDGALRLAAELAWRAGVRQPGESEITAVAALSANEILPMPRAAVTRWAPVLQALPPGDARRRLALLIVAQEAAPLVMRQAPAQLFARWGADIAQILGDAGVAAPSSAGAAHAHLPPAAEETARVSTAGGRQGETQRNTAEKIAPGPEAFTGDQLQLPLRSISANTPVNKHLAAYASNSAPETAKPEATSASASTRTVSGVGNEGYEVTTNTEPARLAGTAAPEIINTHAGDAVATPAAALTLAQISPMQRRDTPAQRAFDEFHTAQGGLFYLLNFLNRGEAQALVEAHWRELQSGWAWLFRLGQELKLDEGDAVLDFLAQQCGLENTQQLADLSPLPVRAELLALAQRWYGKVDVWRPELLALNARVQFTPSHVDVYAPLNSVRLPVRLAGLDINPGWLPWLGRVVTFHYDS